MSDPIEADPIPGLPAETTRRDDEIEGLEAEARVKLSATLAWNFPTVADIGAHLLEKLGFDDADEPVATSATTELVAPGSFAELLSATEALDDDLALRELMRGAS